MAMGRIFILVGTWASILVLAGVSLGADPRRPGNPPVAPVSPQPASTAAPSGGGYAAPHGNGGSYADPNRRAAAARRAAQGTAAAKQAAVPVRAAKNAAATPGTTSSTQPNSNNLQSPSQTSPYGYGYGRYYPPYGYYSTYGYIPAGATPYVLGYNPWTGSASLYPYAGSSYNSQYGYQYPYYENSYLGYGYPAPVFVPADQLFGLEPIEQLMGINQ
jgi:hypothetical protein